jgi:rhodanese-related sulfurtransferase
MRSEEIEGGTLEHWSPQEVLDAHDRNDVVLIDVRSPQEFAIETINGSLLAPILTFNPDKLPTQTDKRIVFYCGGGGRSRKAAELSLSNGTKRIAHMEGGFRAWKESGLSYLGIDTMTGNPKMMP